MLSRFRATLLKVCGCVVLCQAAISPGMAQLSVLSGDAVDTWRRTQVGLIAEQLQTVEHVEMKAELEAQQRWLEHWQRGKLGSAPLWSMSTSIPPYGEPTLDPNGLATELRSKLLGERAKPTRHDTEALSAMLEKHSDDVGVRQLHLHWLDQPQYRKEYCVEIATAAAQVLEMIGALEDQDEEIQRAKAHCLYRRARALAYRELPDVLAQKPLADPAKHASELYSAYAQLKAMMPSDQMPAEFVLIAVRMLRRDHWNGRALALLESYGQHLDPKWLLKKRRDMLRDLGWEPPAAEAAQVYAVAYPEEVARENTQEVDD